MPRGRLPLAAHAATLAMLSLVLLLRTLVPAGYMIAPAAGWPALILCEAPAAPVAVHHEGHPPPAKPDPPCAYAALASPALPPAPPLFAAAPYPRTAPPAGRAAYARLSPVPASLPPPATGPPALV